MPGHRRSFLDSKNAWDVLNKIIFYCAHEQSAEAVFLDDLVIPSHMEHVPDVLEHVGKQMHAAYRSLSEGDQGRVAKELAVAFTDAASAVRAHAAEHTRRWKMRLTNGKQLTDATIGVEVVEFGGDDKMVELRYPSKEAPADERNAPVESVSMWRTKYESLHAFYTFHTISHTPPEQQTNMADAGLLLTRIFAMAMRYDSLSHTKSAYQSALPQSLMRTLQQRLGVAHECYASPLNHYFPTFCSIFHDVDRFFGSKGSFYSQEIKEGCYECNPPFDNASVVACFRHVHLQLICSQLPLCFVVVIPSMDFDWGRDLGKAYKQLEGGGFLRHTATAQVDQHVYHMGLQHKRTGEGPDGEAHWKPTKPSQIYFFANDAGASKYAVSDELHEEILSAFREEAAR